MPTQPEIIKTQDIEGNYIIYAVRIPRVWVLTMKSSTFAAQILRLCAHALEDLENEK